MDDLQEVLADLGADAEVVPCDPELADTAAFCAHYGYELADSANAIMVVGKGDPRLHVLCVVLADSRLDVNGTVRRRLGRRRVSFAGADETRERTGMELGGVTPLGVPDDLPIWIDARVLERERVVLGGGSRDRKVVGAPGFLAALPGAEVVEGLATPVDA